MTSEMKHLNVKALLKDMSITPETWTNKNILDIHKRIGENTECTIQDLADYCGFSSSRLRKKISQLHKTQKKLRGDNKTSFFNQIFHNPQPAHDGSQNLSAQYVESAQKAEIQSLNQVITRLKSENEQTSSQNFKLKLQASSLKAERRKLKRKSTALSDRLQKKMKLLSLKKTHSEEKHNTFSKLAKMQDKNDTLNRNIVKLRQQIVLLKKAKQKSEKLMENSGRNLQKELQNQTLKENVHKIEKQDLEREIVVLKDKNTNLSESIAYLEALLQDQDAKISLYDTDKKAYTTETSVVL